MKDYASMVGMSHQERLTFETQVRNCNERKLDPRLQPGFPFFGRYFKNKARIISYDPASDTVEVEIFVGLNGSSFREYHWDVGYYLSGFDDSSYLPLTYLEEVPLVCSTTALQQAYAYQRGN